MSWADDADFEELRLREKMPHMFDGERSYSGKPYYRKPKVKKQTKESKNENTSDKRN